MRNLATLGIAAALTVFIGFMEGGTWPAFLVGAGVSVVLWFIIFFGRQMSPPPPATYLIGAVVTAVAGVLVGLIMDGGAFPVGAMVGGLTTAMFARSLPDSTSAEVGTDTPTR